MRPPPGSPERRSLVSPMFYFISGLQLQTNQPLAGLVSQTGATRVDVEVWLGKTPPGWQKLLADQKLWYVSSQPHEQGQPHLTIWTLEDGAWFRLVFSDRSEFVVDRHATQIWGQWSETVAEVERTPYLLGPVLSFVLSLRGATCLHASAISIGEQSVAFVGPTGVGKSSLAAAFASRGYSVLADDLVAVSFHDEDFFAYPSYPGLGLRVSNADAANDYLDLDLRPAGYEFEQRPLPLAAIYFLTGPDENELAPRIEPISARAGLLSLIANTWATRVLDPAMRSREFSTLSGLSTRVPLRRIRTHAGQLTADVLCEPILGDLAAICSTFVRKAGHASNLSAAVLGSV